MGRALGIVLLVLACAGCNSLIFHPQREHVLRPDQIGLDYRDVAFTTADGVRLHGWFLPARGERLASLLFLHGNAENISTHIASVAWLPAAGVDVLLFDYRGYGRSAGEPSLDGLHLDFVAALAALRAQPEVDQGRIVIFGQSLGGALAITATAHSPDRDQVQALIVEGAFTSYRALAREKLGDVWLTWPLQGPLSFTIDDRYRPIDAIAELAPLPVLVIQGEADIVVPAHHGRDLYAAAGDPKMLWLLPEVGHIQAFAAREPRRRLLDYLGTLPPRARQNPRGRPGPRRGRRRRAGLGAAVVGRPQSPATPAHP